LAILAGAHFPIRGIDAGGNHINHYLAGRGHGIGQIAVPQDFWAALAFNENKLSSICLMQFRHVFTVITGSVTEQNPSILPITLRSRKKACAAARPHYALEITSCAEAVNACVLFAGSGQVHCMALEIGERAIGESSTVRGAQNHMGRLACFECLLPTGCT
jgi:hypothetical protein